MELSRLELKGFKSFGDRVTINFDSGITGIVGPNGCGKSNVVDAIRWVLGEQKSRALRSDKMENVIFNGTRKRKATQLAEVSLTFNNTKNLLPTEYTQVTITRRYYRSGESEYLLNGVTCRLKDITGLFMDTGIASNSYAIIELKMIDDILNDKDNSRLSLFEEAAGISKFKTRKKETLRKLENTDADLDRVEDLIYEIEKNLKSLEKQAKQADKYFRMKEEYRALSVAMARVTVRTIKEALDRIQRQMSVEEDKKIRIAREQNNQAAAIEAAKKTLLEKEKTLSSRQKALNQLVESIREQESNERVRQEKINNLTRQKEQLEQQITNDRKQVEELDRSLKTLREQETQLDREFSEQQEKVGALEESYQSSKQRTASLKARQEEQEKQFIASREKVYNLQKELEIKQVQLGQRKQALEKASHDDTSQTNQLVMLEKEALSLNNQIEEKKQELKESQEAEGQLNNEITAIQQQIEAVRENRAKASRTKDRLQNEYNLTKSMVENLEGFPEAVKFLKKNNSWGEDIPLLSDVISCKEQYRTCIENYLSQYMNYYIVPRRKQAVDAVNLLIQSAKGKANLFVAERMNGFRAKALRTFPRTVPALSVVEYEKQFAPVVEYVLRDVYILEENCTQIPEDPEATFVSHDGSLIQYPYSVGGGSVGLFEGKKLGRARNLEKLNRELDILEQRRQGQKEQLAALDEKLQATREQSLKNKINQVTDELAELREEYVGVKTRYDQLNETIIRSKENIEDTQNSILQLNEEIEALTPELEDEETTMEGMQETLHDITEQMESENAELSERSAVYNRENIKLYQLENRLTALQQEISFKAEQYDELNDKLRQQTTELEHSSRSYEALQTSKGVDTEALYERYEEKERMAAAVNEAERDYYSQRGEISELEEKTREFSRERENAETVILESSQKISEYKLQLNSVKERLSVEFELDLDELLKEEADDDLVYLTEEELRSRIEKVRDRMKKMGQVNPMAMEAYNEMKERFDFISQEKNDLEQAKESLLTTIQEIDEVARENFLKAFEEIKTNFLDVFRTLFTEEDDCDLRLSNPDQPLESSIDIMARPKGKKPLTINQLSGGEKTLTAISLLFAIYLLKPAPFCIFDEVDAPLDDANIDKFNKIVKRFSRDSQFIIVTHNKRTMSSTDVIYGVTMIEQGISSVVPVDLRELA